MTKLERIEKDVAALTPEELAAFRAWFVAFDAEVWDRQVADDIEAGKLDALADAALADHRAGRTSPL